MSERDQLQEEFKRYVDIANRMSPQTADNMLIVYAFYKQSVEGDNREVRPTESSNVIQTFKYDAWKRLEGMPREVAMRRYIETIKKLQEKESGSSLD